MSDELLASQGQERATAERRDAQRYPFICPAELTDLNGNTRISARTTDLSLHGCYIDTLNPFPVDTRVRVQLNKNDQRLELQARVTACHMGSGMGLMFEEPNAQQSAQIRAWLEVTAGGDESSFRPASSEAESQTMATGNARFGAMLVKVLERKGILTHSEADELLRDLNR